VADPTRACRPLWLRGAPVPVVRRDWRREDVPTDVDVAEEFLYVIPNRMEPSETGETGRFRGFVLFQVMSSDVARGRNAGRASRPRPVVFAQRGV
jgi:hypothetical protein